MARLFLKQRENLKPDVAASSGAQAPHVATTSKPLIDESSLSVNASAATAAAGVSRLHENVVIFGKFGRQEEKPERRKSQGELMFGRFSSYSKAANEALYG